MIKKFTLNILSLSVIFTLAACTQSDGDAKNLQEIVDNAAAQKNKTAILRGKYFIEKPIKLTSKHSGLKILGKDGASISGGVRISNWEKDGDLLKAKIDADAVEAFFVDGERKRPAQSPTLTMLGDAPDAILNGKPIDNKNVRAFTISAQAAKYFGDATEISNIYLDLIYVWINQKVGVLKIEPNADKKAFTVFVTNDISRPFFKFESSPRFKVKNMRSGLTEKGSYFFDKASKTLFYNPESGQNAKNIYAVLPKAKSLLDIVGDSPEKPVENIELRNLSFRYCTRDVSANWKQGVQSAFTTPAAIRTQYAKNIAIENCDIEMVNGYAISFYSGSKNCVVENCLMRDLGAGGVKITEHEMAENLQNSIPEQSDKLKETSHIRISNNIICRFGRYNKGGTGVFSMKCGNITVDHNTIFDGYYSGVATGFSWGYTPSKTKNIAVTNNKIFDLGHGKVCDMAGIYTLADSPNSIISGNEIYNVKCYKYGGHGIYNDASSQKFVVENNYIHHTNDSAYFMHHGKDCIIRNNVIADSEKSSIGLGGTMFSGLKDKNVKVIKKLSDGFVFERNIVVFKSPAKLMRTGVPIPENLARFDGNIYWNENGGVDFSKVSFDVWKNKFNQDKSSLIADPKLDGATPKSDVYKKIGFVPFDISKAGVLSNMADKLNKALNQKNTAKE